MNTGTVSTNLAAPTIQAIPVGWSAVRVKNNTSSAATLVYQYGATTLSSTTDSTLEPGDAALIVIPAGVTSIAFGSAGVATADIQEVKPRP